MKSRSSSSIDSETVLLRDPSLVAFVRSILEAAGRQWPDGFVTEPNAKGDDPAQLYTDTHYALAAVLLGILSRDASWFEVAAARLRLWNRGNGPMTFFNSMAVCLAAIVARRSGTTHTGLEEILTTLLARTAEHRQVAWKQWCGNNAYLQQVAVDTVLLPLALGQEVTAPGVDLLIAEFRRFRTPEGFFFDLPRSGREQEPICPPTYIMKVLFLAGVCQELHPVRELKEMFEDGMAAAIPLLSREGHFCYFGRTDNSPFAAGLTIFNLRKAGQRAPHDRAGDDACVRAERYYLSFPRTSTGMLQSNRFANADSLAEMERSRDAYAYVGQYSLASCAYALLGCYWFPRSSGTASTSSRGLEASSAASRDLGVVRLTTDESELIVRTGSEVTAWDRRYLGPTILRYQSGRLLVGAISKTISTDKTARPPVRLSRARKAIALIADRFVNGIEQLDGTSVGFLPVLRRGAVDYVPYTVLSVEVEPSSIRTRHGFLRLHVRGVRPCLAEMIEILHNRIPGLGPKQYTRPAMKPIDSIELTRTVRIDAGWCRIEDTLSGDLDGKRLLFSIRHLPGVAVRVRGLEMRGTMTGWGSDGRQDLVVYEGYPTGRSLRYECDVDTEDRRSH